jgi:hypothetical protein
MGGLGGLIMIYLAWVRLVQHQAIADRPLLLFGILLVSSGLQLLTIGLLAELQARTYHESQDKPTYAIREILQAPLESDVPAAPAAPAVPGAPPASATVSRAGAVQG